MKVLGRLSQPPNLQSIESVWREDLESIWKEDWAKNLSQICLNLLTNYKKCLASVLIHQVLSSNFH